MAGTCGATFAKVVLIIFNILFFCAGVVLICVGGWIVGSPDIVKPLEVIKNVVGSSFLKYAGILLISMGVFIFFVTALGLFAAIKENVIALSVYIALLVVTLVGLISGGVVAIVFKDNIIDTLGVTFNNTVYKLAYETNQKYYTITNNSNVCISGNVAASLDYIQDKFQCCGIHEAYDYSYAFNFNLKDDCKLPLSYSYNYPPIPLSCYPIINDKVLLTENMNVSFPRYNGNATANNDGCMDKMVYYVSKYAPVLIGIGLGFGFLELFGIIFAVCLCQNPELDS